MIQDLENRQFHIKYEIKMPKGEEKALFFRGREVLIHSDGEDMRLPLCREMKADFQFLFKIDDEDFYLCTDVNSYPEGCIFTDINIFRMRKEEKHLDYAGIEAYHLSNWYENNKFCGHCGHELIKGDKERALIFKELMDSYESVDFSIPFTSIDKLSADVVSVNQKDRNSDAAVILECSYMNDVISKLRFEKIQIELYSYSGIMVSQENIHFSDVDEVVVDDEGNETVITHEDVQGVYVINGYTLEFVQILPKTVINGYIICKSQPGAEDVLYTDDTIRVYDKIITEGKDLYDGKIIE